MMKKLNYLNSGKKARKMMIRSFQEFLKILKTTTKCKSSSIRMRKTLQLIMPIYSKMYKNGKKEEMIQ